MGAAAMVDADDSSLRYREGIGANAKQRAKTALQPNEEPASLADVGGEPAEQIVRAALPCQPPLGCILSTLRREHPLATLANLRDDGADQIHLCCLRVGGSLTAGIAGLQPRVIARTGQEYAWGHISRLDSLGPRHTR